ncbi:hypothetical protein Pan258_54650 [Symmachiella dynata]|nr:hypothetical protein Pan258_54650 [Symmachiella dynata]
MRTPHQTGGRDRFAIGAGAARKKPQFLRSKTSRASTARTAETAASCANGTPIAVGNRCHPLRVFPPTNTIYCFERAGDVGRLTVNLSTIKSQTDNPNSP